MENYSRSGRKSLRAKGVRRFYPLFLLFSANPTHINYFSDLRLQVHCLLFLKLNTHTIPWSALSSLLCIFPQFLSRKSFKIIMRHLFLLTTWEMAAEVHPLPNLLWKMPLNWLKMVAQLVKMMTSQPK